MMTMKDFLGSLSIVLSLVGYGNYLWSIYRKRTRPHIFSWLIWSILMSVVFCAQWAGGGGAGAWVTGASAAMCFIITLAAFRRGEKSITSNDWIAFLSALIAIPLWKETNNPLIAVVMATIIDALAYYPTFRKSYATPFEENFQTYCLDIIK